jgi:hypothetical protein
MGIPPAKRMETNPCNVLQDPPSADSSYRCPVVYLCCDEGQGMEFNLTVKFSREPASTTEDGTRFHSLMDLRKKECPI